MFNHITGAERVWLSWYRRLRITSYVGTAADLYTCLTGRPHPRTGRAEQAAARRALADEPTCPDCGQTTGEEGLRCEDCVDELLSQMTRAVGPRTPDGRLLRAIHKARPADEETPSVAAEDVS